MSRRVSVPGVLLSVGLLLLATALRFGRATVSNLVGGFLQGLVEGGALPAGFTAFLTRSESQGLAILKVWAGAIVLTSVIVAIAGRAREGWRARLGLVRSGWGADAWLPLGIGALALVAFEPLADHVVQRAGLIETPTAEFLSRLDAYRVDSLAMRAVDLLSMAITVATIETFLTRGWLQRGLQRHLPAAVAIVLAALTCSVAVDMDASGWVRLPQALWWGWVTWRAGSAIPAWIAQAGGIAAYSIVAFGVSPIGSLAPHVLDRLRPLGRPFADAVSPLILLCGVTVFFAASALERAARRAEARRGTGTA